MFFESRADYSEDSVESDLAKLEAIIAAHDRELEKLGAAGMQNADAKPAPRTPAKRESKEVKSRGSVSSSKCQHDLAAAGGCWKDRAFPGLSERRWLPLLVDEMECVWADPVTHRQFIASDEREGT